MFKVKYMGSVNDPEKKSATKESSNSKFYLSKFWEEVKKLLVESNKGKAKNIGLLSMHGLSSMSLKEIQQSVEKYDRFKHNSENMYITAPEVIDFYNIYLSEQDMFALFSDKPEHFLADHIAMLSTSEKQSLITIASMIGAINVCKELVKKHNIEPSTKAVTFAFFSGSEPLVDYYVNELDSPPFLNMALNYTAHNLDTHMLQFLVKTYKEIGTSSNLLATAAYNENKEKTTDYIQLALDLGAKPSLLSLVTAISTNNMKAFKLLYSATPSITSEITDSIKNAAKKQGNWDKVEGIIQNINIPVRDSSDNTNNNNNISNDEDNKPTSYRAM